MLNEIKRRNQQKYRTDHKPLFQGPFYNIKKIYDTTQSQKIIWFIYKYDLNKIQDYGLKKHLKFYHEIFTKANEIMKGKNIQYILKQVTREEDNTYHIYTKPYDFRLNQYINKKKIGQVQAQQIIKEILQALYSVYKDQYSCFNVRAQNFVRVSMTNTEGKVTYRWKLDILPYGYHCKDRVSETINCPHVWRKEYQPPQGFTKTLDRQQLSESLVWNVGCIWLHILSRQHLLNSPQSIKKFDTDCMKGNTINLQSFDLNIQISSELSSILKKMLHKNPEQRMKVQQMFELPRLAQNILNYIKNQCLSIKYMNKRDLTPNDQSTTSLVKNAQKSDSPIQISSIFEKEHKLWYISLQKLIYNIAQIVEQKNIPQLQQQKGLVSQIIRKNTKNRNSSKQQISPRKGNSSQKVKRGNASYQLKIENHEIQCLTLQQIQKYIRPYKFYYNKTIFLFRFTQRIAHKLTYILTLNLGNKVNHDKQEIDKDVCKEVFIFRYVIIFMRLIYLQTLLQNLKLKQNVFNIPQCTQNISNVEYLNTTPQWTIFSSSAIYEGLIVFMREKLEECEKELAALIEQGQNQEKKLSETFIAKIKHIEQLNYKVCTLHRFMPHYQKAVKNVTNIIDIYSAVNTEFKNAPAKNKISQLENMRNIGYLTNAMWIESQKLYNKQNYYRLFERFIILPKQQQDATLRFAYKSSLPSQSNIEKKSESQVACQNSNQTQIFDFMNYQRFLKRSPIEKVAEHVYYLLRKFQF